MRIPYSRILGMISALVGLGAIATLRVAGIGIAVVAFLVAGTAMSGANRIASSLVSFVGKRVVVEVWGTPIPLIGDGHLVVASAAAFGAGLLIRLHAGAEGPGVLLKVAQPRGAIVGSTVAEIQGAAYVSWAGARITGDARGQTRAVTITVESTEATDGAA